MKTTSKTTSMLLLALICLGTKSTFGQSAYREPVKQDQKANSTPSSTTKYSKEDQAMIDFYSNPKNAEEISKTSDILDGIKPLGDAYTITDLVLTKEDISKKVNIFDAAYKSAQSKPEKINLLNGIIYSYKSAAAQVAKAEASNTNFSESDKSTIAKYKEYYSKVLGILSGMLDRLKE